jgi:SAM-dependent methyltransferase
MGARPFKRAGSELEGEYRAGFHDRLAEHWPEPREQLHAGGWRATHQLVRDLGITATDRVLDICCGEGATACWIARTIGAEVIGIELIADAVAVAQSRARREQVAQRCAFVCGTIFELPFADESFDVLFGQDPDGLAHQQRLAAFRQCWRVLRPGGRFAIQHWIPGPGSPPALRRALAAFVSLTPRRATAGTCRNWPSGGASMARHRTPGPKAGSNFPGNTPSAYSCLLANPHHRRGGVARDARVHRPQLARAAFWGAVGPAEASLLGPAWRSSPN